MYTLNENNAALNPNPTTSETQHGPHLHVIYGLLILLEKVNLTQIPLSVTPS